MLSTPTAFSLGTSAARRFQCFWSAGTFHSNPWKRVWLSGVGCCSGLLELGADRKVESAVLPSEAMFNIRRSSVSTLKNSQEADVIVSCKGCDRRHYLNKPHGCEYLGSWLRSSIAPTVVCLTPAGATGFSTRFPVGRAAKASPPYKTVLLREISRSGSPVVYARLNKKRPLTSGRRSS